MDWQYNTTTREYTLRYGAYQATVWGVTAGKWAALVISPRAEEGRDHFASPEEAQAWCLTQLAAERAKGGAGTG